MRKHLLLFGHVGAGRTARIPQLQQHECAISLTSLMSRSGKCQLFITRTQGTQSFTWEACSSLDLTQLQHLPQYLNTISSGKSQTEKGGKMRLIILFFNIPHPCLASLSCLLEGSLEEQAIFYLQGIVKKKKNKNHKTTKKTKPFWARKDILLKSTWMWFWGETRAWIALLHQMQLDDVGMHMSNISQESRVGMELQATSSCIPGKNLLYAELSAESEQR